MRNRYLVIQLLALILHFSCKDQNENSSHHQLGVIPKDTTLFVSFTIDGKSFRYFQTLQGTAKNVYQVNDTLSFMNIDVPVGFDTTALPNGGIDAAHPYFTIVFNKRYNQSIDQFKWPLDITSIVKNDLNYSCILKENSTNDTLYDEWVSLGYKGFSSDHYFRYYSFNKDSIEAYNSRNKKVQFSKVERVWDNYILYEGTFSAVLYSTYFYPDEPKAISLKNGKFRFIQNVNVY